MKTISRRLAGGYTLSEVLIAMSIGTAIAGTATWFMVEGARIALKTTNTSLNDLSQWSIFTAISVDSKVANAVSVYSTFTATDMANATKRLDAKACGNVLILSRSHQDAGTKLSVIDEITGYVFNESGGILRKFKYATLPAERGETGSPPFSLEKILTDNLALGTFQMRKVADHLNAITAGRGIFLVREKGRSGLLTVEAVQGAGSTHIVNKKLIEASFFIRG